MKLPPTINGEKVYSCKQFADLLGVSVHTIYKGEKTGTLIPHYTKTEHRRYYTQSQYEAWKAGEL